MAPQRRSDQNAPPSPTAEGSADTATSPAAQRSDTGSAAEGDDARSKLAREAVELYRGGATLDEVRTFLAARGVRAPRGGPLHLGGARAFMERLAGPLPSRRRGRHDWSRVRPKIYSPEGVRDLAERARRMRLEGATISQIAKRFRAEGVSSLGGGRWHRVSVEFLLERYGGGDPGRGAAATHVRPGECATAAGSQPNPVRATREELADAAVHRVEASGGRLTAAELESELRARGYRCHGVTLEEVLIGEPRVTWDSMRVVRTLSYEREALEQAGRAAVEALRTAGGTLPGSDLLKAMRREVRESSAFLARAILEHPKIENRGDGRFGLRTPATGEDSSTRTRRSR